jgi:hypothetical protein
MSNSLGTFFWLSFIFMFVKFKTDMPKHGYVLFLLVVIIFMYFINVSILKEHCGNVNSFTVLKATLFPWLFIFANMMFILSKFPWWLGPFSNTFGLLIARFAGCNAAFLAMMYPEQEVPSNVTPENLKTASDSINQMSPTASVTQQEIINSKHVIEIMKQNPTDFLDMFKQDKLNGVMDKISKQFTNISKEEFVKQFKSALKLLQSKLPPNPNAEQRKVNTSLHYVYSDPSLLINRFTMENFDETIDKLSHIIDVSKTKEIAEFKQFVKLKETISEWIWYLLTSSIAISVSYNTLMYSKCTKTSEQYIDSHNNAMANTPEPEVKPTIYTITG